MTTPIALDVTQARARLSQLTVIDVRTPAEYASGHLPGSLNIPLDDLHRAVPTLERAAFHGALLMVCRSAHACRALAEHGIEAMTLRGGTRDWTTRRHELHRPEAAARPVWGMERQVRFTAGVIVLLGLGLGLGAVVHPAFQLLAAAVAGGLAYSALSDTCGMALVLGRLPFNQPRGADLDAALAALRER